MTKNKWLTLGLIGGLILGIFSIWAFSNQIDPLWIQTKETIKEKPLLLIDAKQEVDNLYNNIHTENQINPISGYELISTPFIPTKTFEEWHRLADLIISTKSIVFSSVSGIGSSTIMDRMTLFLAGHPDRILKIKCAPNFELPLHREFIGEKINGIFKKGKLFNFLQTCANHPNLPYVLFIDDLDKINPESLWGPYLWDLLENRGQEYLYEDEPISIPANLFIISNIHGGTGNNLQLNNEHFRRIGALYTIYPEPLELVEFINEQKEILSHSKNPKDMASLNILNEPDHILKYVYSFSKANEIINQQLGPAYQLGQWSSIRDHYTEPTYNALIQTFVNHINGLAPEKNINKSFFYPIEYAIANNGKLKGSNPMSRFVKFLDEKGFLTEFIVGLAFILISTLISFFIYKRHGRLLNKQMKSMAELLSKYEQRLIDHDEVLGNMEKIKSQVDHLALSRGINFEEANFFYQFFADKKRAILLSKETYNHFNTLVDTFLDDGVLSEQEYRKLHDFLNKIRAKIGQAAYEEYKSQIEMIYEKHGQ